MAEVLALQHGNIPAEADHLGVPNKTLYDKLKKYQPAAGRAVE